ncbi:MAG: hypothetical protein WC309_03800 [Candidatus Paceibacterota bacterium]|jgi:hypothetical protein|nr:hypothetical protein [Candidatus Paceibacterota bacterium]
MGEIPEIKYMLDNSSRILLVCDKTRNNFDFLVAAASLFYTLKKIGKIVNCHPQEIAAHFPILASPINDLKSFVLTINNDAGVISDIYYQKSQRELKLFFTITSGDIKTDDIHFSHLSQDHEFDPDLVITLGIKSLESLDDYYENNFKFFSQKPILNLDNHSKNQEYGKINIIEENSSFSELIVKLAKSTNQNIIDRDMATNLFWGVLNYYKGKGISENALKSLVYLKNKGAEIKKIPSLLNANFGQKEKEIIELVLSNISLNKALKMPIILIPKNKVREKKDILSAINFLRTKEFFLPSFVLLWKTESAVGGIMYSADEIKKKKVVNCFNGEIKQDKAIFSLPCSNLQIAQNQLLKALG